jgi:hypothetical protein
MAGVADLAASRLRQLAINLKDFSAPRNDTHTSLAKGLEFNYGSKAAASVPAVRSVSNG